MKVIGRDSSLPSPGAATAARGGRDDGRVGDQIGEHRGAGIGCDRFRTDNRRLAEQSGPAIGRGLVAPSTAES